MTIPAEMVVIDIYFWTDRTRMRSQACGTSSCDDMPGQRPAGKGTQTCHRGGRARHGDR